MDQVAMIARLIAVLVAVVGAFVSIPFAATILLVLGALASTAVEEDQRPALMLATLVLVGVSGGVSVIPVVGVPLAAILANLGLAYLGVAIAIILTALVNRLKPSPRVATIDMKGPQRCGPFFLRGRQACAEKHQSTILDRGPT